MQTLIRGGRLLDPGRIDGIRDVLIKDGRIAAVASPEAIGQAYAADRVIDASGKIITPGLIDMHVHLREPGYEHKETIASGCRSAAYGGFTAVCCMPNTNPVNDSRQVTQQILSRAAAAGSARVYPVAAISVGLKGKRLCDYGVLKHAGVAALSDDGNPVMDSRLMRMAMEHAGALGLLLISHSEDLTLAPGGAMNEGAVSKRLGLCGIPNAAESIMVLREIALSELTGVPVHIAHVSTRESVRAIRDAKQRGVPVTAETAPHYFTLTDEAVESCGTNAKMNPPLRSHGDRDAVKQGLSDGTIDCIATDHAPHAVREKEVAFELAANGIIGLETSLSLSLKLVEEGLLTLGRLVQKMSANPARILGLENGLTVGNTADITIIDLKRAHTVDAQRFQSLSRNTPFDGWRLNGKAVLTMVGGKIVFEDL